MALTAQEALDKLMDWKQPNRKELAEIQLKLFDALLENYLSNRSNSFHYFYLKTKSKFLPEVLAEIQNRGFDIYCHIAQYGHHDWFDYYPLGSIGCTYGDFIGYRFSF